MTSLLIFQSIYFFLPAYFTNITATLSRKIRILKALEKPVDFRKKIKEIPIFGSHKTWRGLISGIIVGILVVFLQSHLYRFPFFQKISLLNYSKINILFFGFLISSGALFGDLLFAFFKRRQEISPGQPWIPFDQINYVVGAFLFLTPFFKIDIIHWLIILFSTFFLHLLGNYIGYCLGLSRAKL